VKSVGPPEARPLCSLPRALVVCILLCAGLSAAAPAGAAIANQQVGTYVTSTSGSISPTLPSASAVGTLLVAVLSNGKTSGAASFTAPSGWVKAAGNFHSCCGEVEVWYYANNPGGLSSATFAASTGTSYVAAQLSEWTGVVASAPLDRTGTANQSLAATMTISTSGATTVANELGITVFNSSLSGLGSFVAGSGWTHLFSDPTTSGDVSDYRLGLPIGTASETETVVGGLPQWLADIVTFKPSTCTGGSLTLTAPATLGFPSLTINGTDQTISTTLQLTPDDESGSGAGWNITGTSTTFTNAASRTLPTTATQVTAAAVAAVGATCALPTSSITYPTTLPAGGTPPTAVKLYNAAAATGTGPATLTLTARLSVPANSYNGTYNSTWTLAIVSGP
jgi:hypothetical protein